MVGTLVVPCVLSVPGSSVSETEEPEKGMVSKGMDKLK